MDLCTKFRTVIIAASESGIFTVDFGFLSSPLFMIEDIMVVVVVVRAQ